MILDNLFVILAGLLTVCLIPLYIYRQKVFTFSYKKGPIEFFVKDLKLYLHNEHPRIHFDYSIIEKTKNEKDIRIRETLIVENIINQFFYYEYEKKTQKGIQREKLWTSYEEKSYTNPKTPSDWKERRDLAWQRDKSKCNRCRTTLKLEMYLQLLLKIFHKVEVITLRI